MRPRLKSTDKWGLFAVVAIVGENHQLGRIKEIETTVIDLETQRKEALKDASAASATEAKTGWARKILFLKRKKDRSTIANLTFEWLGEGTGSTKTAHRTVGKGRSCSKGC